MTNGLLTLRRWLLLVPWVTLTGCAIQELKDETRRREASVARAETQLKKEQTQNAKLQAERVALQEELTAKELTVAEMQHRVQRLQLLNANSEEMTQEQLSRKRLRARQLAELEAELKGIELPSPGRPANDQANKRRTEEARRRLRQTLQMIADS